MLSGLGRPSHLIFLRRQVSQATTTLLRFLPLDSEGLGASSSLLAFEVDAAAEDVLELLAFARFFCDVAGEPEESAAVRGDGAGRADVDAVPAAGAGELSKEMLERPLRIETSSKATCASSSLLYDIVIEEKPSRAEKSQQQRSSRRMDRSLGSAGSCYSKGKCT